MNDFDNFDNYNNNNGDMGGYGDGNYTVSHDDIIQDDTKKENYTDNTYREYNSAPYVPYGNMPESKPPKKKKRYGAGVIVLASLLAAIIGASSSIAVMRFSKKGSSSATNLPQVNSGSNASNVNINVDETVASIAQAVAVKCGKSVVGIRTTTSVISFFGGSSEATGEGSGVVYTSDGYIVTNYHVIESAVSSSGSKIEVFLENSKSESYSASVIGYNIAADLAVIKIDANGLIPAEIGSSSDLQVGQYVVTIGAPGGLEFMGSVTYGIISGLSRVVSTSSNIGLIQTDAAINPGNSGGALLDSSGKLIGINSSKIVAEEYEGMGFAIPINTVVELCNKIIQNKDKAEAYVGITVSKKYTAQVLQYYGYPVGAVVLSVDEGSPAYEAGIRKGDIITEFAGVKILEYTYLEEAISGCKPKDTVTVKIYRSGKNYSAKLTVGSNSSGR